MFWEMWLGFGGICAGFRIYGDGGEDYILLYLSLYAVCLALFFSLAVHYLLRVLSVKDDRLGLISSFITILSFELAFYSWGGVSLHAGFLHWCMGTTDDMVAMLPGSLWLAVLILILRSVIAIWRKPKEA